MYGKNYKGEILKNLSGQVSHNQVNEIPNQQMIYKNVFLYFTHSYSLPQPIPIDTINKFWGIDSKMLKHDETVQKQSFEQSYKNFWSFVDSNAEVFLYNQNYGSSMRSMSSKSCIIK